MPLYHVLSLSILSLSLAVAACGDDGASASTTDTTADTTADTATSADTSTADAPDTIAPGCEPGASVSGQQGDEGLALAVCGARLTVASGAIAVGTTIELRAVAAPGPAPFERELASPVIEVVTATDFSVPAELFLPDTGAQGGYREGAYYEPAIPGWLAFEACPDEGGVSLAVTFGAAYALLRDTVTFPESPDALGSGTITTTFQSETVTWTFDDGYAIHDVGSNGLRSVTLIARRTPAGGSLQQLDLRLSETADHAFAPLQVTLLDTSDLSGGWSWLEPVHGPPTSSSLIAVTGDRVVGALTVDVGKGAATATMTIQVDAQTGRYRFPPEGLCLPEG